MPLEICERDEPYAAILAQAVEPSADCAAKLLEKQFTFVRGSGAAWSQTKLCHLRASASGSSIEKKYHEVGRVTNLLLNR